MMSNNNTTNNNGSDLIKATLPSSDFRLETTSGGTAGGTATATIDCVPFINSWMAPLPQNIPPNSESATPKIEQLTMPVNQATLEAVYGSAGVTPGTGGSAANPYCNTIGYNNSAAAYNAYNQQYYQMAFKNAAPLPFTNYFNTAAAAVASANPSAYYPAAAAAYGTTGFDYNSYATSNQYYNNSTRSTAAVAANNYYNAAFPYVGALGTESLPTSTSTLSTSQTSPYPTQKPDHKPLRRNKKKKPIGGLASPEPSYTRVFVYELEDLCSFQAAYFQHIRILIENVINQAFGIHSDECDQANVEDANVDEVADSSYANQTSSSGDNNTPEEKPDIASLSSGSPTLLNRGAVDGLQQMARKYQRMKDVYNKCKDNLGELINYLPNYSAFEELVKHQDAFLETYRRCLRVAVERSTEMERFTNVVISNESLATTMAKLLIFNFAAYVPVENIYSTQKIGKPEIMERISLRFKKSVLIASSNAETSDIAKKERIPCWRIREPRHVETFYHALDKCLL